MGKGKTYELTTKKKINAATHEWVKAHRPDYSGSSVGEVADLMVVWEANRYEAQQPSGHAERFVHYTELKKRSAKDGNRATVMSGADEESGKEELRRLLNESPSWTEQSLAVKFDHRELIVLDARELYMNLVEGPFPEEHEWEWHGARLTPSGNISMRKPSLDDGWPSSTAGTADHIKLLHEIGVENYDIIREHRP